MFRPNLVDFGPFSCKGYDRGLIFHKKMYHYEECALNSIQQVWQKDIKAKRNKRN